MLQYLFYIIEKSEKNNGQAPFLQTIDSFTKSKPVKLAKDATKAVVRTISSLSEDFKEELNQKSKTHKSSKI